MPWLWSRLGEREDWPPEFGSVRVLYSAESQKMIQAKNKLLMQCKRLWMGSERENWNLSHWSRESVDQIIDLLQRWATWIMDDEMRDPEKVEELLSSLPTHWDDSFGSLSYFTCSSVEYRKAIKKKTTYPRDYLKNSASAFRFWLPMVRLGPL